MMDATLIAGPTASGKSGLALRLAERCGGVVVNADSMQVYDGLKLLTARPEETEAARVEHRLYGHVPAGSLYSTGRWLADVEAVLAELRREGRHPVIVGGTGLYFEALLGGLSEMPAIPDAVREGWRERLREEGAPALHRLLGERDAETAARLEINDGQRIVRALEVLEATGRSISAFQQERGRQVIDPQRTRRILIMPERGWLNERIDRRFDAMVAQGAIDEVRAILERRLDPALPVMKAIGVRELGRYLEGEVDLVEATAMAKSATRRYAKRQTTWFRNRFSGWETVAEPDQVK